MIEYQLDYDRVQSVELWLFTTTHVLFLTLNRGSQTLRRLKTNRDPFTVNDCSLQRGWRVRRHLSNERCREEQWDLLVRTARHIQEHLQDRHYLVPFRRSTLRNEIRILDVRRVSGKELPSTEYLEFINYKVK